MTITDPQCPHPGLENDPDADEFVCRRCGEVIPKVGTGLAAVAEIRRRLHTPH